MVTAACLDLLILQLAPRLSVLDAHRHQVWLLSNHAQENAFLASDSLMWKPDGSGPVPALNEKMGVREAFVAMQGVVHRHLRLNKFRLTFQGIAQRELYTHIRRSRLTQMVEGDSMRAFFERTIQSPVQMELEQANTADAACIQELPMLLLVNNSNMSSSPKGPSTSSSERVYTSASDSGFTSLGAISIL